MRVSTVAALFISTTPAIGTAAEFQITKVADSNGTLEHMQAASINERGTVVFAARQDRLPSGTLPPMEVWVWRDGALTSVHTPGSESAIIHHTAVNDNEALAFFEAEGLSHRIHRGTPDGGVSLFVDNSGAFKNLAVGGRLANDGTLVFSGELPSGGFDIYNGPDPAANLVLSDDGTYGNLSTTRLRDDGTLLFAALDQQGAKVYANTNPVTELFSFPGLSDNFLFNEIGQILVNDFLPPDQPGGTPVRALLTGTDPVADRFVDTTGPFSDLLASALNSAGTIAFHGLLDAGGNGIFVGPDIVADRVVATGDPLFGSTVVRVQYGGELTDNGQIVFTYELASGEFGVAVASVPEPATALGIVGLGVLMMRRRRH